jgi:aminoglycoside phosphotransferase (APT) family kinase protein
MDGKNKYLLKTFALKNYEYKNMEYDILKKMGEYNVKCSRPVEIGTKENEFGYMILTYIEGFDAEEELKKYSETIQYNIGLEAGQELLKIHKYTASENITPWYGRKLKKHQKYVEQYNRLNVKIENDVQIIKYINENIVLMKNRPNIFQHDDFHIGNLIVKDGKLAGVIDFNRFDWGDPVHEFLKVGMFSSAISIPFSIGQIRGYHNYSNPDGSFWELYSLYLAMGLFSSIVWQMKVDSGEISKMMEYVNRVKIDHNNFKLMKPRWYIA